LKTLNTSAVSVAQERKSWVSIAVPALEFKSTIADFQLNSLDKESWKPAIVVKSRIGEWIKTHFRMKGKAVMKTRIQISL